MSAPLPLDSVPALARLNAILDAAPESTGDEIGLFMAKDLRPSGYDQTPLNARPFAWTGGDGVHFCLLDAGAGLSETCPVVMTAPMAFPTPNLVLGRDLGEFLSLGIVEGFFALDGLIYSPQETIGRLDATPARDRHPVLAEIARSFGLTPVTDAAAHLAACARDAEPLIVPAPEDPDAHS
ncbi:hypothetical protein [Ovoidimarina sediminis]|uniref:hypothetical protein n=1 Tax=Ovoidimarina sediminis TaxID=3079856 RepID=UPI002915B964|nr:hypothetical protein [Rhodophyticola sp. MJ-SS7]MDU8945035.1 hypothetical protein [Rhodophyticola sp. MJ-SS7]